MPGDDKFEVNLNDLAAALDRIEQDVNEAMWENELGDD